MKKYKVNIVKLSNNNNDKNAEELKLTTFDIFLSNVDFFIKHFKEHYEINSYHYENFNNWNSIEKYEKLFHQYELFNDELKQPLFRKRFLIQILILLNSFISPINQYQKNIFNISQDQKENIFKTIRNCIDYLKEKYNIFINDLIENEKIWSKWKEKNCPEITKKQIIYNDNEKDKNEFDINSKIKEVKSLFNNFNTSNIINTTSNFINEINIFKETKVENLKFSDSIEGLSSEVPFFGTYLEQIYKDLDPEEEEENTKERILNNMPSFSWKFLRLLSEGDISKINSEEIYKLLSISEEYYKNFAPKEFQVKFNFKILIPPPKIELKPKEEITLPKELLEQNNKKEYMNEETEEFITEEGNQNNKPKINLPKEILNVEKIKNNNIMENSSINKNINEIKITPKKEEEKEVIRFPLNLKKEEKNNLELEKEKIINISNTDDNMKFEDKTKNKEKDINLKDQPDKQEELNEKKYDKNVNYNNKEDIKEINITIKEVEKPKLSLKINMAENKNATINFDKNNEIIKKDIFEKQTSKDTNQNNNINNNLPMQIKQSLNININEIKKEKEILNKDKELKDNNKYKKIADSTIPEGIINISKDSKNASLTNSGIDLSKKDYINIKLENKSEFNINIKDRQNNNIINDNNNKIQNITINKSVKENNINENKANQNIKIDNNNYHNTNKNFTNIKNSNNKSILTNISSGNKINESNSNKVVNNNLNNKQEISNYDNKYDNKYNSKYTKGYDNKPYSKNDNKSDNNYNNKYNRYDNKHSDKYNNYDNNKKYDYRNDNKYENKNNNNIINNRYDNKNYHKYDNNYKYDNNNHYDNRNRYDNKSYGRNQEKDNNYLNKKRSNEDKYDNYMSSNKKRK